MDEKHCETCYGTGIFGTVSSNPKTRTCVTIRCPDCQPEYDLVDEVCDAMSSTEACDKLRAALRAHVADLRARAVPESTQYVAWEAGANRLTVKSWRGVWQWHTWRGDGPGCIATGLAGTMQAAIAAAEEASE